MRERYRRDFILSNLAALSATWSLGTHRISAAESVDQLRIAKFRFDVTPPMGHSLCGGWIQPVVGVDDPLECIGIVLLGAGKPIVLCSVDWTGLLNDAHIQWRQALAKAAGTTADRVALHCVHQHNAPFACLGAQEIVAREGDLPHIVLPEFYFDCLERARSAVAEGLQKTVPVTHVGQSESRVDRIASNRRVHRDDSGKVVKMRGSSCRDEQLRAMPEGTIDPMLKTVAFFNGEDCVASCHYYATHPMSYYGDGRVSSDFVGLARKRLQEQRPDCLQMYFTGCAGNVSAGKYNDGSKPVRQELAGRTYEAMVRSSELLRPEPIESLQWQTVDMVPRKRESFSAEALQQRISNKQNRVVGRNRPSYMLSWLQRLERQTPIVLSSLAINDKTHLLHLPAESFIEYQLRAQQIAGDRFVATAAYGDGGPWYIPTADEYPNGGYEVSVAFCSSKIDETMTAGIRKLLS